MSKILYFILGILFTLLGVIGLLIPIVPQVPFFAAGIVFLCMSSSRFKAMFKGTAVYRKYLEKYVNANDKLKKFMDK